MQNKNQKNPKSALLRNTALVKLEHLVSTRVAQFPISFTYRSYSEKSFNTLVDTMIIQNQYETIVNTFSYELMYMNGSACMEDKF